MALATGAAPTNVQAEGRRAARLSWAVLSGFAVRVAVMLATKAYLFPPVVYYITFPEARYRHPIEPLMLMLAVYTVGKSLETRVRRSEGGTAV